MTRTTYGLGTIERLPSGRYRVRVPDGRGGYRRLGTYPTADEAERMRVAALDVRAAGPIGETLASYGERVIDRWRLAGKRTAKDDLSRWRTLVVARSDFAGDAPRDITRAQVRQWSRDLVRVKSRLGKPLSPQTIKHALVCLRRVLAEALDDGLVDENVAADVAPPKGEPSGEHWTALTSAEIFALLTPGPITTHTLDLEQRTAFALAIYTGLRQGELAALRWSDVRELDGAHPHLIVSRSWDRTTKTRRARRVDLIPEALVWLRQWREHARGSASTSLWGRVYSEGYDWGWSETKANGRGVCWIGARRQAGITRRVWFHHLRDTCASHLLTGTWGPAWSIGEVAALLGHTSTWVTERYARILPGALAKRAAETFHESPTAFSSFAAEVPGITGRAMGDSNARPTAPEAVASEAISRTSADRGRSVEGLAREVLESAAAGRAVSDAALLELARAVLDRPDVAAALRVLHGGPATLAAGLELAAALMRGARVAEGGAR